MEGYKYFLKGKFFKSLYKIVNKAKFDLRC